MSSIIQSFTNLTAPVDETSTFIQELLTPDPTVFNDPLTYFVNNSTTWRSVLFDSGALSAVSSAIFSQAPIALFLNQAQTQLWAIEGATTGTQVLQKITIATNTQVSLTTITGIDANEIIYVAAQHPLTGAIYVATRRLPEADGLLCLYSLNNTTAVATKIAESEVFLSTSANGFTIFPDGTAWLGSNPGGVPSLYQIDLTTAQAKFIYSSASTWGFENLAATPRNTFIGTHSANGGAGIQEGSLNLGYLRSALTGGSGASAIAVKAPIDRRFYLGMPIIKQVETDFSGAVSTIRFFLQDGSEVTTELDNYGEFPLLPYSNVVDAPSEVLSANGVPVVGLAFGSVTTASWAVLAAPPSTNLPGVALKINNELNVPVYVTWDNFTNLLYLGVGEIFTLPLKSIDRKIVNSVRVKAVGANASIGNIYGSLIY